MESTLRQAHSYITTVMASGVDFGSGLRQLIDYCRSKYPDHPWATISDAAIGGDLNRLQMWFSDVLEAEPPAKNIVGLWCGLYPTVYGYRLYLAGTERVDRDDPTGDWAVGPAYWPDRRYAPPTTFLQSLPKRLASYGSAAANLGEYVLVLGYACLAMIQIVAMIDPRLVLGDADARGLAAGFDNGDFVILGTVTWHGLTA